MRQVAAQELRESCNVFPVHIFEPRADLRGHLRFLLCRVRPLLEELRKAPLYAAMVTDEFGIVRGLVTIEDLVEEVVGDLGGHVSKPGDAQIRQTGPDMWMVDGMMEIDPVTAAIPGLEAVVHAEEESFQTLAGLIVQHLERLPREGETFTMGELQMEVVDMDRQCIDKVCIRRVPVPVSASGNDGESAGSPN